MNAQAVQQDDEQRKAAAHAMATAPPETFEYRDSDGEPLLFPDQVAVLAMLEVTTVRWYNSYAKRQRRAGHGSRKGLFPPYVKIVGRRVQRSKGSPVTVNTPLFRRDRIVRWRDNMLGPGGLPAAEAGKPADERHAANG